jgi:hypothetical protein
LPRVQAAIVIACEAIRSEALTTANHAARVQWARLALADPAAYAAVVLRGVLAQNPTISPTQATGVSDPTLQTAVNAAINLFVM